MEQIFHYRSHIQEIPRIRQDIEILEKEWVIPLSEIRQILVIIEELFSNIIRYAFDDNLEHVVDIRLVNSGNQIEIEMIDDGIPFNPLEHQKGSFPDPVNSDPGGMGLTLIRTLSSEISYHRESGRNHLIITKRIKRK
jgi:anti-sigma regulatory factor (Ser/Thr protein kinase)